ncbi:proclotting enzyme-like, partial [Musca vetustissima]|uniref:proclotting enzyme-like n=1 Tax=Musca vetustissima TaxID=27455 RepID=UPI002AB7A9CC
MFAESSGDGGSSPQPYVPTKYNEKRIVRECKSYRNVRKVCYISFFDGVKNADPKEFSFMAMLLHVNGNERKPICGGSLISNRYVVSAASCFYTAHEPNIVRLGDLDYNTSDDDAAPVDFSIASYKFHDEFDDDTLFHNIALVKLNASVQFNDYIVPACLPRADGRDFKKILAAGWGPVTDIGRPTGHLKKIRLDKFNDDLCLNETTIAINTTIQMCAGSFNYEVGTCAEDGGGPLFVHHPDYNCLFLVLGITSHGE